MPNKKQALNKSHSCFKSFSALAHIVLIFADIISIVAFIFAVLVLMRISFLALAVRVTH
jgi:hypothetical protein